MRYIMLVLGCRESLELPLKLLRFIMHNSIYVAAGFSETFAHFASEPF